MKGKLIVIEGTDCSGKHTQATRLSEILSAEGFKVKALQFPRYDTPTGQIIGGAYLGKPHIGKCIFPEGAPAVPSKVASLYFAADRVYNIAEIENYIKDGYIVILDRYIESNMAFQGGKIFDIKERRKMYKFLHTLEYKLLKLPKPDIKLFLYMPYEFACELKKNRPEVPDEHEKDEKILRNAENAYKEIAKIYSFSTVNCVMDGKIKSIDEISNDVLSTVRKYL